MGFSHLGYGYGYSAGANYGYDPWYDYGYTGSTQYFDVDVYQLDNATDYGSVYTTSPPLVGDYPTDIGQGTGSVAGAGPPGDPIDNVIDEALAEGQVAMLAGQYGDARRLFSQAMFLDDGDGRAKLLFALASLGEGEIDVAGLALRRALETTPELIDNPWDLRTVYSSGTAGLPDEASYRRQVDELSRYLSDFKEHRGARLLLGYLHFGWGDAQRAEVMFDRLVQSNPKDELAISLRDSAARIVDATGVGG